MGKEKKSKERKRSRSRDRDSKKKRSRRDSSTSSDGSSKGDEFDKRLEAERREKKRQQKADKQLLKDAETPEEKRARRLAKKQVKDAKRKKAGESVLPESINYTNLNNPFNDTNLTKTFVWGKKLEQEGRGHLSEKEIERENRERVRRNLHEMEELKRTRDARRAAADDAEMIKRDEERRQYSDWNRKEVEFQLEQARVRSKLRIEQDRAKPIDVLSRYIAFGDDFKRDTRGNLLDERDAEEFELVEPGQTLKALERDDYEDLIEDIKVFRQLEGDKHAAYWTDIRTVVDDELGRIHRAQIHNSVQSDINKIIKGKSSEQLSQLESQIQSKIRGGGGTDDMSYWESLHGHLKAHLARTRLKELHQNMLKLKLKRIREEQMRDMGEDADSLVAVKKAVRADEEEEQKEREKRERKIKEEMERAAAAGDDEDGEGEGGEGPSTAIAGLRAKGLLEALQASELDDEQREHKWRQLSAEQLEAVTLEMFTAGEYEPKYGREADAMPGIEIVDGDEDASSLAARRDQHRKKPEGATAMDAAMVAIARKGMEGDEATFGVEAPIEAQAHLWSDKYRPRKPRYLNRVQTGFDWNKYNQTHYDMDNPPPKIVQGYKFNIFYPDLLDQKDIPSFSLLECEDKDFAILRFKAGPPYEDIAFKIVNREWEVVHRFGYKCQFQNNVFQLWFQFKRYRYRR